MDTIKSYENFKFEENEIGMDDVSISYLQQADCTQDQDETNEITLSTANNGVARFIVIKTERWSIDDIDSLVELIKDFKKRALLD